MTDLPGAYRPSKDPADDEAARRREASRRLEPHEALDNQRIAITREQARLLAEARIEARRLRRELETARARGAAWAASARRWRGAARRAVLVLESVSRTLDLTGRPWRRPGHPRTGV
jgi:hypothetical protein